MVKRNIRGIFPEYVRYEAFVLPVRGRKKLGSRSFGKMELLLHAGKPDIVRSDDAYMDGLIRGREKKLGTEPEQYGGAFFGHGKKRFR